MVGASSTDPAVGPRAAAAVLDRVQNSGWSYLYYLTPLPFLVGFTVLSVSAARAGAVSTAAGVLLAVATVMVATETVIASNAYFVAGAAVRHRGRGGGGDVGARAERRAVRGRRPRSGRLVVAHLVQHGPPGQLDAPPSTGRTRIREPWPCRMSSGRPSCAQQLDRARPVASSSAMPSPTGTPAPGRRPAASSAKAYAPTLE